MKKKIKLSKKRLFILSFVVIVAVLFIIKTCNHGVTESGSALAKTDSISQQDAPVSSQSEANVSGSDEIVNEDGQNEGEDHSLSSMQLASAEIPDSLKSAVAASEGALYNSYVLHPNLRTNDVSKAHGFCFFGDYHTVFADSNHVQLVYANAHGITPVKTQNEIRALSGEKLVEISSSPYYYVDNLTESAPYLVPRAQVLLNCIGRNFMDSLFVKNLPQAQLIVTSGTRSTDDVARLQGKNGNSASNSCHFYGTTIDISYVRYHQIVRPDGSKIRVVRDDTLKQVLGEVLRDLRESGACYVKHEKKQSCFHITVR